MTARTSEAPDPAELWEELRAGLKTEPIPLLERLAGRALELEPLAPDARVLDVDAGPGTVARLLADRCRQVVCTEDWPADYEELRERLRAEPLENVEVVRAPADSLPLPKEGFDAAFWVVPLDLPFDRRGALREVRRALKPERALRVLVWSEPHPSEAPSQLPARLTEQLGETGYADIAVHDVTHRLRAPSQAAVLLASGTALIGRAPLGRRDALWRHTIRAACEVAQRATGPVDLVCPAFVVLASRCAPARDLEKN